MKNFHPSPPGRLERCRAFIVEHYSQPLTLHDLAEVSATSRFRLVHSFKKAFGLAPHAYQIRVRIQKACALLSLGEPIASVAAETGFADQSHFGRHFLHIVGLTPAQYAKAAQCRREFSHGLPGARGERCRSGGRLRLEPLRDEAVEVPRWGSPGTTAGTSLHQTR